MADAAGSWASALRGPWARVGALSLLLLLPAIVAWFAFPSGPAPAASAASAARSGAPAARPPGPSEPDEVPAADPQPGSDREAAPRQSITGTVLDADGRGLEGATVACADRPNLSATTDASGRFELPPEAAGCKAVATAPDGAAFPPVVLRAGKSNRLEASAPGGIAGVVVDELGRPLQDYTIAIETFTTPDGERGSNTGRREHVRSELGAFELEGLSPGRYVLTASAKGRPPTQSSGIEVENGRKSSGIKITIGKGGTLTGVVTDRETKHAIAGARVRLDGMTASGGGASTTTDDAGRYTLEGIPAGAFSVRFSHADYRERIEPLDARGQSTLSASVDLAKKGDGASSEWTGIGATLAQGGRFVEVASVIEGGPAATAGVKGGDKIVEIEGRSVEGATVADCVNKLRGPEGSKVTMGVDRAGARVDITITRAKITR